MYIGIDVGGTNVVCSFFDKNFVHLKSVKYKTPIDLYSDFLTKIVSSVKQLENTFNVVDSIGIALPGFHKNEVIHCANIPSINQKKLICDLENLLKKKIFFDNDANCFSLSESTLLKKSENETQEHISLGITIGTGIGVGIIIDNKIIHGRNKICSEFAHQSIPIDAFEILGNKLPKFKCGCGKYNCIETFVSGTGLSNLYYEKVNKRFEASDIYRLSLEKDTNAQKVMEQYIELLCICLSNLILTLDPDEIIVGGGVSNMNGILEALVNNIPNYLLNNMEMPKIKKAIFENSGSRGAALLCVQGN